MDEETLIPLILSGDEAAFTALYEKHSVKAYRTALLITGNKQTAEDVVQESFILLFRTLDRLKSPKAFGSYFYRIITRTAWKLSAKDKKNIPTENTQIADGAFSPQNYAELYEAVKALDVKLRTTVVLFYFNDLSVKDIAKITGTLEGTVKSRLHTAREKLSNILDKEDYYG